MDELNVNNYPGGLFEILKFDQKTRRREHDKYVNSSGVELDPKDFPAVIRKELKLKPLRGKTDEGK